MTDMKHYIELLRGGNFNCFPISKWPKGDPNPKRADNRYKASRTELNQPIGDNENYGYLGMSDQGTATVDIDNKEKYRKALEKIAKKFMVVETPNGWHLPAKNLTGKIQKTELFDYSSQKNKIIEIQGPDHYVMGIGSEIYDKKTGEPVMYQNIGTDEIFDAEGMNYDDFIDNICKNFKVEARKETNRSTNRNQRDRFKEGKIPTKGTSNNYFFNAALQCNTEKLTKNEAIEKINEVYNKWTVSDNFSDRPWSNILVKIDYVYDTNQVLQEGRPRGAKTALDRTEIAKSMIDDRQFFSDVDTGDIFENCNGFLERINNILQRELQNDYPEMEQADYNSILFKLVGLADTIPPANKNLIVFKNCVVDKRTRTIIETDELADLGFIDYNYLEATEENKPARFIKILFDNIPEEEYPRVKAGLRAILSSRVDPRISIIFGDSGIGKSTILLILVKALKQYALAVELDQFLDDKFIQAKIRGKILLVFQELPQTWKDFAAIKALTGEQIKTVRGFMQDSATIDNKLKIWASTNHLSKIPEKEKNAMYTRRLSLIHNKRKIAYPEDPTLIDDVAEQEGEKIISWILNLKDEECQYENSSTVRREWEELASPEVDFLKKNYDVVEDQTKSVVTIIRDFEEKEKKAIDLKTMITALEDQGFIIKFNVIQNIGIKPKVDFPKGQTTV